MGTALQGVLVMWLRFTVIYIASCRVQFVLDTRSRQLVLHVIHMYLYNYDVIVTARRIQAMTDLTWRVFCCYVAPAPNLEDTTSPAWYRIGKLKWSWIVNLRFNVSAINKMRENDMIVVMAMVTWLVKSTTYNTVNRTWNCCQYLFTKYDNSSCRRPSGKSHVTILVIGPWECC